jgi:hypothetical protein
MRRYDLNGKIYNGSGVARQWKKYCGKRIV